MDRCEKCKKAELNYDNNDHDLQEKRFKVWIPKFLAAKKIYMKTSKSEFGEI